jgi:hypothetical protein
VTGQDEWRLIDDWDRSDDDWARQLDVGADTTQEQDLRRATYAGMPFGDRSFVHKLERSLARGLHPGTPGRKAKVLAVGA